MSNRKHGTMVTILGPDGEALAPSRRRLALAGGDGRWGGPPYDAADNYGQHMAAWQPFLWSPDGELNQFRDRIVSRVRDMVRNDGWAAGTVTRILDNAIGSALRPISKPDHRHLAQVTSNKAFDHTWAKEFGRAVDAHWRSWSEDTGYYCDVGRNQTFPQMMRLGFRHKLVDGDALAVMHWLPDRVSVGRARYCTSVQMVDPDRLSNPQNGYDIKAVRGGVEIDKYGAAIAYHIRKAHAGDWFSAGESQTWERVARETDWGRSIVVHDYEHDRAAQHRGGAGILTPVLQRLKMLVKYDGTELDAAIINAIFAAFVESPFDPQMTKDALDDGEETLNYYQDGRVNFHKQNSMMLGNARIPIMYPGEKINTVRAERPSSNFNAFESAMLRNVAAGAGVSAQMVSNDWSDVNYSSARAAMLEAWKTMYRRRDEYTGRFCSPIRSCFMEEAMEIDDLPLPLGAPTYIEAKGAYSRCKWMGPGRGWVDPVAEKQGSVIGMDAALSTLEIECAEQGLDFEEVLEQRKYELDLFKEYNIPIPAWAGQFVSQTGGDSAPNDATKVSKKPQAS